MNTQIATGPITPEGKEVVRTNAVTHGLTAKLLVLPGECEADWADLLAATLAAFCPSHDRERDLAHQLAEADWRLRRVRRTETAFLAKATADLIKSDPTLDHDAALAAVFTTEPYTRQWRLFLRYQASAERTYNRIHNELKSLQRARVQAQLFTAQMAARAPRPAISEDFVSQPEPKPKPRMPRFLTRRQRREAAKAVRLATAGNVH
jgi:hypothetical protein